MLWNNVSDKVVEAHTNSDGICFDYRVELKEGKCFSDCQYEPDGFFDVSYRIYNFDCIHEPDYKRLKTFSVNVPWADVKADVEADANRRIEAMHKPVTVKMYMRGDWSTFVEYDPIKDKDKLMGMAFDKYRTLDVPTEFDDWGEFSESMKVGDDWVEDEESILLSIARNS